jgi:hypothetical protein
LYESAAASLNTGCDWNNYCCNKKYFDSIYEQVCTELVLGQLKDLQMSAYDEA